MEVQGRCVQVPDGLSTLDSRNVIFSLPYLQSVSARDAKGIPNFPSDSSHTWHRLLLHSRGLPLRACLCGSGSGFCKPCSQES